ncbi:uncharacterized protein EV420DRAFT_842532 [Desarmillaria tabescens]|uniref:Protein-S-isoprenylcysteine O-methyltransferase n=1 Tax=Armillaria tabescens TaxID=1929756 RepID=A0AA39MVR1_ARMTA|nr:uncharacterized protein EV420DRAFT_842532 [Desarmillaria tabescens]KAK0448427.1 hypothetical protein EV420DRAFT_842532 [Desarmillaria tabescens]
MEGQKSRYASIPLLFSDAICMRLTGKPPNDPLPLVEHIVPDWRERFLKSLAWPCAFLRVISWSICIIEAIVILAYHFPSLSASHFVLSTLDFNGHTHGIVITPLFLLGNVLTIAGTLIRLCCYRVLGRLFTFELSIHQDHCLIVRGPYAIVRHPSYTGMILTILGAICSQSTGSWVMECGLIDMWFGKGLVMYWLLVAAAVVASLLFRISVEDRLLHRKFGREWTEWNQKVPYVLIPGVY